MRLPLRHLLLLTIGSIGLLGVGDSSASGAVRTRTVAIPDVNRPVVEVQLRRQGHPPRKGSVGVLARNRLDEPRRFRIRYASGFARPHFNVRATGRTARRTVRGSLTRGAGLVVPVAAHDIVDFGIRFVARQEAPPEELRGHLLIASEPPGAPAPDARPLVLRVRGVRSEERLVTVFPKKVTLPVTVFKGRWTGLMPDVIRRDDGEAFVDLRGPGSTALAERGGDIDVVFRRDDGTSLVVPVRIEKGDEGVARLVIPGTDDPDAMFQHPGRYTAELPLGPGRSAPSVKLTTNVRVWLGWAIVAVLLGVVLGRMVPPLLRLERIRRRGRDAVKDSIRRFRTARVGRDQPASYDLDSLISPQRWARRGRYKPSYDEPARLLRALKDGRDEKPLNATVIQAEGLRGRVERWARLETSARALVDLLNDPPPPRKAGRFRETKAYLDGFDVLSDLQTEPAKKPRPQLVAMVGELTARASRECRVIKLSMEVWLLQKSLDETKDPVPPDEVRQLQATAELVAIWKDVGDPHTRQVLDFNRLTAKLEGAKSMLDQLAQEYVPSGDDTSSIVPDPVTRVGRAVGQSVAGGGLRIARAPLVFFRGLLYRLRTPLRGWLGLVEFVALLLSLAIPVLVYVVTLYNDTWGSWLDFISAFAVGFLGKVALDFGVGGITLGTRQVTEAGSSQPPAGGTTVSTTGSNGGTGTTGEAVRVN